MQDEFDFLIERQRFKRGVFNGRIGGADQRVAVPRNGKHDAPIAGVGHHDRVVAGQKFALENQMDSLAGRDDVGRVGIGHLADGVSECARRIDDDGRVEVERDSGFDIDDGGAVDEAVSPF